MIELIMTLMVWISVHTEFIIPDPPSIEINTKVELRDIIYGCKELKTEDPIKWNEICREMDWAARSVVAVYNHDSKVIHLPEYFNPKILSHRSILLHELVHHMQYANGYNKKVECMELLESQAYDLQEKWLEENNAEMPDDLKIGPIMRSLVTRCSHFHLYSPGY